MTYEYICIDDVGASPSGKTRIYRVSNKSHGDTLGWIRWFGTWRQYVYMPEADTVYSAGCLRDVERFITERMEERSGRAQ